MSVSIESLGIEVSRIFYVVSIDRYVEQQRAEVAEREALYRRKPWLRLRDADNRKRTKTNRY